MPMMLKTTAILIMNMIKMLYLKTKIRRKPLS